MDRERGPVPELRISGVLLLAFLGVGLLVQQPEVAAWDLSLVRLFHHSGGPAVGRVMRSLSQVGGTELLVWWMPAVLAVVWKLTQGRRAAFFVLTMLGEPGLEGFFKIAFHRARPDLGHAVRFDSYPSGHVTAATILAATLIYIGVPLCRTKRQRRALMLGLPLWPLLMAVSRVYLGRHFVTDVAGAMLLGTAWVLLCRSLDVRQPGAHGPIQPNRC